MTYLTQLCHIYSNLSKLLRLSTEDSSWEYKEFLTNLLLTWIDFDSFQMKLAQVNLSVLPKQEFIEYSRIAENKFLVIQEISSWSEHKRIRNRLKLEILPTILKIASSSFSCKLVKFIHFRDGL